MFYDLSGLSSCISKQIMRIISKSHCEKEIYIFAIHSSSRHEKGCRMSVNFFCLFQCSRNQQCFITFEMYDFAYNLQGRVYFDLQYTPVTLSTLYFPYSLSMSSHKIGSKIKRNPRLPPGIIGPNTFWNHTYKIWYFRTGGPWIILFFFWDEVAPCFTVVKFIKGLTT